MRISVTEFRRRLKDLKTAAEPVHLTRRGKYVGYYLSERAKEIGLQSEARWREEQAARGFTPEVMKHMTNAR